MGTKSKSLPTSYPHSNENQAYGITTSIYPCVCLFFTTKPITSEATDGVS